MKKKSRHVEFILASLAGLLWIAGPAAAQHQHSQPADAGAKATTAAKDEQTLKVGKKADLEFGVETAVGEMWLKPGRYQIQHRVDGADHFVHFTEVTKALPSGSAGGRPIAHPGEVKCRLEPLEKKASTTTVYTTKEGEGRRVVKVLIDGENVAHVF